MSKIIVADASITAPAGASRIKRTPGVGGYLYRYIANHIDLPDGSIVSSLNSHFGTTPNTLNNVGGTAAITMGTDNGIRHLYSPGGSSAGGRLLGAHTTQRPMTIAAVIKANANVVALMGMTGSSITRNGTSNYQGTSGAGSAYSTVVHDGWVFVLLAQSNDGTSSFIFRADGTEVTQANGAAASGSFGGLYFGATATGQAAYMREMIAWPTQLNLTERNAVHAYMKTMYPDLW